MPPADGDSATVRLAGRLPPQEIVGEYQAADLLVLPSVGEGFPLVVQEALACGTPVLVSRDVAQAFPARDRRCVFEVDLGGPDPAAALRAALRSLARVAVETWEPADCPLCRAGKPVIKPGSRGN